jgi:hypothetical protein
VEGGREGEHGGKEGKRRGTKQRVRRQKKGNVEGVRVRSEGKETSMALFRLPPTAATWRKEKKWRGHRYR